jgi:hypothetical protein
LRNPRHIGSVIGGALGAITVDKKNGFHRVSSSFVSRPACDSLVGREESMRRDVLRDV